MKPPLPNPLQKKSRSFQTVLLLVCLSLILFLSSLSCSSGDQKQKNASEAKQELLTAVDNFNKAFAEVDIPELKKMITENYQHTNGSSEAIGKEEWFAYLVKRRAMLERGSLKVHGYAMDQLKAEIFGHTAIVTARIKVDRTQDELRELAEFRITTLWVKEAGNWKRAGFHDGRIE